MEILLVTTHNLATNPRLVKELELFIQLRHRVTVICFEFKNWSYAINLELVAGYKTRNVTIISIPAGRSPFISWFLSVTAESLLRFAGKFFALPLPALSLAVSRRSYLLVTAINKVSGPDWVIGHYPGAIWPVLHAAKKFGSKVGFDMEDYHPGEGNNKHLQSLNKKLIAASIHTMNYVSFAAPLILEQVAIDTKMPKVNWLSIINYFPGSDFIRPVRDKDGPVKLVWFSQNINSGRGLELILPFIKLRPAIVTLHLVGNLDMDFFNNSLKGISNVIIHAPMKQHELHHFLHLFDVGLALDIPLDSNRDLALTNKLIAYLQSGLYVLATSTTAQDAFLKEFPGHGKCFDYKKNTVAEALDGIIHDLSLIRDNQETRYRNFENRNWENESKQLTNMLNELYPVSDTII
ncbi:MAG: hypothetical protein WKI04_09650 [Ferruginibacter sp.]